MLVLNVPFQHTQWPNSGVPVTLSYAGAMSILEGPYVSHDICQISCLLPETELLYWLNAHDSIVFFHILNLFVLRICIQKVSVYCYIILPTLSNLNI